jgi:hypothetical protein
MATCRTQLLRSIVGCLRLTTACNEAAFDHLLFICDLGAGSVCSCIRRAMGPAASRRVFRSCTADSLAPGRAYGPDYLGATPRPSSLRCRRARTFCTGPQKAHSRRGSRRQWSATAPPDEPGVPHFAGYPVRLGEMGICDQKASAVR